MRDLEPATKLGRGIGRTRFPANGTGFTGKARKGVERSRKEGQTRDIPTRGGHAQATITGEQSPKCAWERKDCRRNCPIQQLSPNQNSRAQRPCVLARRVLRASYVSGTAEDHPPSSGAGLGSSRTNCVQYSRELRQAQLHLWRTAFGSSSLVQRLTRPGFSSRSFSAHEPRRKLTRGFSGSTWRSGQAGGKPRSGDTFPRSRGDANGILRCCRNLGSDIGLKT